MASIISEGLLVISIILGNGFGLEKAYQIARKETVRALTMKSPSLSSFTKKLTR